jgi:hypothetical protein
VCLGESVCVDLGAAGKADRKCEQSVVHILCLGSCDATPERMFG